MADLTKYRDKIVLVAIIIGTIILGLISGVLFYTLKKAYSGTMVIKESVLQRKQQPKTQIKSPKVQPAVSSTESLPQEQLPPPTQEQLELLEKMSSEYFRVNEKEIIYIISNFNINIRDKDIIDQTHLHHAAENGYINVVRVLKEKGADVKAKDKYGNTPLHLAVKNGHKNIVSELLKEDGADVVKSTNKDGNTPLHLATLYSGNEDVILELLKEDREEVVNATNNNGDTPLHLASFSNDNKNVILKLLERRANIDAKNNKGNTPLHLAISYENQNVVLTLLKEGADVNAENNSYITPLHLAAEILNRKIVLELLKRGADVEAKTKNGYVPSDFAIASKYTDTGRDIANLLIRKKQETTNPKNGSGDITYVNALESQEGSASKK